MEQKIRQLLSTITFNQDFLTSPPDAKLQSLGLDSVGMIELVYMLEEQFKIEISDEEVLPRNFESVRSLTQLVKSKHAPV